MALRHLSLKTRDLEASERFYTDVLGFRVAFRHPGMVFLESDGGDDLLDFCQVSGRVDPDAGGLDHFGLRVDRKEWRSVRDRLQRAKVKVTGRRGRWSIYFRDPNGYTVELYAD